MFLTLGKRCLCGSTLARTRKVASYAWTRCCQGKLCWKLVALLAYKLLVWLGYWGGRLIEPAPTSGELCLKRARTHCWKLDAPLPPKSLVWLGFGGERLIGPPRYKRDWLFVPSSNWFPLKFPSGQLDDALSTTGVEVVWGTISVEGDVKGIRMFVFEHNW